MPRRGPLLRLVAALADFEFDHPARRLDEAQFVARLEAQIVDDTLGQPEPETVAPFRNAHGRSPMIRREWPTNLMSFDALLST
jgi:hypothetical protein